jgi:hypothetical protein
MLRDSMPARAVKPQGEDRHEYPAKNYNSDDEGDTVTAAKWRLHTSRVSFEVVATIAPDGVGWIDEMANRALHAMSAG